MDNVKVSGGYLEREMFCSDLRDSYGPDAYAKAREMFQKDPNSDFGEVLEKARYIAVKKNLKPMIELGKLRTNS